eukprot:6562534-Karenia_brevis.AAC.1
MLSIYIFGNCPGGEKVVQRRRSTLCAVKDSMLEARFSGRWDQQLDKDGIFFTYWEGAWN